MHKTILPLVLPAFGASTALTQALTWAEEIAAERSERTADLIRARIGQR